eukprot:CAMPEP_0177396536 /NCGR_PEP_ID=MMETSP0368-20130122/56789_1 /TAXON_ID=447022 ORGANISM="Scrippsiella hangoei-like, Strain SHHI-4" /NCGR_SAMPLE_ID=MMETSP0368 /ASSEMBLY_ACC=CAM_ASM_000363 /LENGTH=36 /DNA_ID= /DNA_START= /DNA_END= /DNA_ORIENTATION=
MSRIRYAKRGYLQGGLGHSALLLAFSIGLVGGVKGV